MPVGDLSACAILPPLSNWKSRFALRLNYLIVPFKCLPFYWWQEMNRLGEAANSTGRNIRLEVYVVAIYRDAILLFIHGDAQFDGRHNLNGIVVNPSLYSPQWPEISSEGDGKIPTHCHVLEHSSE